jgi:hypothetical protein
MSIKQIFAQGIALLALMIIVLALAACQGREQLEQEAATLEAAAESVEAEVATEEATEVPPTAEPSPVPPTIEPAPEAETEPENGLASFHSSDDSLSFVYPNGWSVENSGSGRAILANSDNALTGSDESVLQSGDVRINITLVPANMLADYGLHMGSSAEEALQFIPASGIFALQQEDTQVGEIQALALENTANAAQMSITTSNQEGVLIAAMHSDQVVAFVSVVAPMGEYANFEQAVHQLVDSIDVSVTADELIALITSSGQGS